MSLYRSPSFLLRLRYSPVSQLRLGFLHVKLFEFTNYKICIIKVTCVSSRNLSEIKKHI